MILSPLSTKFTFVLDDDLSATGSFGLDPGQKTRYELGAYIKMTFKKEILKNVTLDTKIDLFSNYLNNPQYVDVKFGEDTTGDGEYDTFSEKVQFKELFGLGLTYSF